MCCGSKIGSKTCFFYALKTAAFLLCSVGFFWKVSDSVGSFTRREIGTKTEIKNNFQTTAPNFAICRHPDQILNLRHQKQFKNVNMKHLSVYEKLQGHMTLGQLIEANLINDSRLIRGFSVISRGQYAGTGLPSLISIPAVDPQNWKSFYHPLFGICFSYKNTSNVIQYVGKAGLEFAKISLDFKFVFPPKPVTPFNTIDSYIVAQSQNPELLDGDTEKVANGTVGQDDDRVIIVAFEHGSFLQSQEICIMNQLTNKYFSLTQEVLDKTNTQEIFQCSTDPAYLEDDCLYKCLINRFVSEFQCIHGRLVHLASMPVKHMYRECGHEDLLEKTWDYHRQVQKAREEIGLHASRNKKRQVPTEIGLVRIREILADFLQDDSVARCGCPAPCRRKVIKVSKWPTTADKTGRSHTKYAVFHIAEHLKVYSYHLLYTGSDLVADIGGYLGLFLGLSAFGLVELLEKMCHKTAKTARKSSRTFSLHN